MGRSKWKFFFISNNVFRYLKKNRLYLNNFKKDLLIYCRSSTTLTSLKKVYIHKGNTFIVFLKTKFNIFQRYGFFSFTRRPYVYKLKK